MANYSQLVSLVRRKVGSPEPRPGGEDKLDNDEIIEYLNNAFDQMCDAIFGFDRYVEFTITAAGLIAVTDPVTNPPTVGLRTGPAGGSYPVYYISDARSYIKIENKTTAIADDARRIMVPCPLNNPAMQDTYNSEAPYYFGYSVQGTRGFTLLPITITETNTIGITYRRRFIRYALTTPAMTGTGEDDLTLSGIYTANDGVTNNYRVEIEVGGGDPTNPNTFRWSNDGGVTWEATGVAITGAAQTLENGLSVTFPAVTGHDDGDRWDWTATAPLLTVFSEEEQRGFPVLRVVAECARDLDDTRYGYWLAECLGVGWPKEIGGLLGAFKESRFTEDLTLEEGLGDPYGY